MRVVFSHAMTNTLVDQIKLRVAPLVDKQLSPLGLAAMARLPLRPGHKVIDVGCGAGQTCLQLADRVGPTGGVLGLDVSTAMVGVARERAACVPTVSIDVADAQTHPFEETEFDAVFSRFGVMFFEDPVAAFSNLRRALKKHGQLAFVCWRALSDNDLDWVPLEAARPYLPAPLTVGLESDPPFSLADTVTVRATLEEAGFSNISVNPHDQAVTTGDLDTMADVTLSVGSLGRIVRENPDLRAVVEAPVRAALEKRKATLNAAVWIVTAVAQ